MYVHLVPQEYVDLAAHFNPAQLRDAHGRWSKGGGVAGLVAKAGRELASTRPLSPQQIQDFKGGSAEKHIVDGHFTPERAALHEAIIQEALAGITPPRGRKPIFTMMGGGSAAGKGSYQAQHPELKVNTVLVDADAVKLKLPEYHTTPSASAAAFTHEESSYVSKQIVSRGLDAGVDVLLDATGDSGAGKVQAKIASAKAKGYTVSGRYVTCALATALARAEARGKTTGRVVPTAQIREIHKSVSAVFPQIMGDFDTLELVDTEAGKTVLTKTAGARPVVQDSVLWDSFLNKGRV